MGWIAGALLQRRWMGIAGFVLVPVTPFLPIAQPAKVALIALGLILVLASTFVAAWRRHHGSETPPS